MTNKLLMLLSVSLAVFCVFGELTVTRKLKREIGNNEYIVTEIEGSAGLDVNTQDGASVTEIAISNKFVQLKAKNPNLEGGVNLKGLMLIRMPDDVDQSTLNYTNADDVVVVAGERYKILPLMSAKAIDTKLHRRLPKWKRQDVLDKIKPIGDNDAAVTPQTLIDGYNAIRKFLLDNSVETVVEEEPADVTTDGPALIGGEPLVTE